MSEFSDSYHLQAGFWRMTAYQRALPTRHRHLRRQHEHEHEPGRS